MARKKTAKTSKKKRAAKKAPRKVAKKAARKKTVKKKKAGRPTKFLEKYYDYVVKLCMLGATDLEMADFFGVTERTFYRWKDGNDRFCQALKEGKVEADANVGNRLYQRAMGYSHPEEKIFCKDGLVTRVDTIKHYPPDTTACIFWLKNRRKGEWRDRHEITGEDGTPLAVQIVDPTRA